MLSERKTPPVTELHPEDKSLIEKAWQRFQTGISGSTRDPFEALSVAKAREVAADFEISRGVLSAIRNRVVLEESIPRAFLRNLAAQVGSTLDPPGSDARWIGLDNLLVLSDTDDATAAEILTQLRNTTGTSRNLIPLPAGADLSRETVSDFLAARAAGEWDHAWGERLISPPSDVTYPYGEFQEDTLRRAAANALDGSMTLIAANATQTDVGPTIWSGRPPGSDLWVYRVDYPGATDPALASETFVVIHDPKSGFRDWTMVRLAGADYPYVPVEMPAPLPSGISTPSPIPGSDGTGDTPCVPAPGPCG